MGPALTFSSRRWGGWRICPLRVLTIILLQMDQAIWMLNSVRLLRGHQRPLQHHPQVPRRAPLQLKLPLPNRHQLRHPLPPLRQFPQIHRRQSQPVPQSQQRLPRRNQQKHRHQDRPVRLVHHLLRLLLLPQPHPCLRQPHHLEHQPLPPHPRHPSPQHPAKPLLPALPHHQHQLTRPPPIPVLHLLLLPLQLQLRLRFPVRLWHPPPQQLSAITTETGLRT